MAVFIKLRKDSMSANKAHHKYYAHMVSTGEVGTEELAEAIQENTTFKRGEVRGIIDELVSEMKRQLSRGQTVCLDGFGRFHLSVQSTPAERPQSFSIKKNVRSVKCNFVPAGYRDSQDNRLRKTFLAETDVKMQPKYKKEKA